VRWLAAIVCAGAIAMAVYAAGYAAGASDARPPTGKLSPIYGGSLQEVPLWACEEIVEWRVAEWARQLQTNQRAVRIWLGKKADCR
jgi:hypothetical protein